MAYLIRALEARHEVAALYLRERSYAVGSGASGNPETVSSAPSSHSARDCTACPASTIAPSSVSITSDW